MRPQRRRPLSERAAAALLAQIDGDLGPARALKPTERARLRDQDGFSIVEVMVSSVLLVAIGLGVYSGLDGATEISSRNKLRSVATTLAQQDLDRIRGLKLSSLVAYNETRTKTLPAATGTTYTIVSRGEWVSDGGAGMTPAPPSVRVLGDSLHAEPDSQRAEIGSPHSLGAYR